MTRDIDWTPTIEEGDEEKQVEEGYVDLTSRIDGRPTGPDRVTVFPADATGVTKMSTWLTVNTGCVVDLECIR